jgi:D-glycero-D-manno-heptose 1,7-bisphosphate phosphatase
MKPALFLDRDGVIIVEKHYLKDWKEVELIQGVGDALRRAQEAGFALFIVSNQSGIGRGLITPLESDQCFKRTLYLLENYGVHISGVYVAPEHPDQPSVGRKPSPHFVLQAIREFNIDPDESHFIGDRLGDLQCGKNAGLKSSILVLTGYGQKNLAECQREMPEAVVCKDLPAAVTTILEAKDFRYENK